MHRRLLHVAHIEAPGDDAAYQRVTGANPEHRAIAGSDVSDSERLPWRGRLVRADERWPTHGAVAVC